MKSGISIDWSCNSFSYNKEQATPHVELESPIGNSVFHSIENESLIIEDPPLQSIESKEQVTPPMLASFQLFKEAKKRGRCKLIDSLSSLYAIHITCNGQMYHIDKCTVRPKVNMWRSAVTRKNKILVKSTTSHNQSASTGSAAATKITYQVRKMATHDLFKSLYLIR